MPKDKSLAFAAEATANDAAEPKLYLRRLHHWQRLGKVLPCSEKMVQGNGRSRRYSDEGVLFIGLLLRIADRIHDPDVLDAIARRIEEQLVTGRSRFSQSWQTATKAQGRIDDAPSFLTIAFPVVVRDQLVVRAGPAPIITADDIDLYVIDLSQTFSWIKLNWPVVRKPGPKYSREEAP
jgi:hypothetical protein